MHRSAATLSPCSHIRAPLQGSAVKLHIAGLHPGRCWGFALPYSVRVHPSESRCRCSCKCIHRHCSLHSSVCSLSDLTPRFTSEPISAVQKPGGPVVLRCSAEPPAAHISWLLDGEPLGSGLPGVEIQHGSLSIASLSLETSGRYQCVANSSAGAVLSRAAVVSMGSKSAWFVFLTPITKTSMSLCGLLFFCCGGIGRWDPLCVSVLGGVH